MTALGRYKVGRTRFSEFDDAHIDECGFMVDGKQFICMGGGNEDAPYRARFTFDPPEGFEGDFKQAPPEILELAVMSEIRFFVKQTKFIKRNEIEPAFTEETATRQTLELIRAQTTESASGLLKEPQSDTPENPYSDQPSSGKNLMALLLKDRFVVSDARKTYMALADISVYAADRDFVKDKIKQLFKSKPDGEPEYYLMSVSGIYELPHEYEKSFLLSFDIKEEIIELNRKIGFAFNGDIAHLNLPDPTEFPENKSISLPGVLERYAQALENAGYDFHLLDTGVASDTFVFCITPIKNRKRVNNLLAKAQVRSAKWAT